MFLTLIIIEGFLKDHVTLMTEAGNSAWPSQYFEIEYKKLF